MATLRNRLAGIGLLEVICVTSLVCNVVLTIRIVQADWRIPASTQRKPRLEAGTPMPPLQGVDLSGRPVTTPMDGGRPTLVYAFSMNCIWSTRNVANIR